MAPVYCLEDLLKFSEGIISNLYSKLAPYLPHPLTHFLHIIWFPDSGENRNTQEEARQVSAAVIFLLLWQGKLPFLFICVHLSTLTASETLC